MTRSKKRASDQDAVKEWVETLRSGLGLVRFSDLSSYEFEQLLEGAPYQTREGQLVIARYATMEGLEQIEANHSDDAEIMAVVAKRRNQLRRAQRPTTARFDKAENVVVFPGAFEPVAAATAEPAAMSEVGAEDATSSPAPKRRVGGLRARLRHIAARVLATFDEEPTTFDEPEPQEQPATDGVLAPEQPRS